MTYLYDDVTERLDMHRRYDALIRYRARHSIIWLRQWQYLGSDGRVRLHNPAFQRMWKLSHDALEQHPHRGHHGLVPEALHDDNTIWRNLRAAVTAIDNP